ncbi:MAG: hypothetical protein PHX80_04390 [Candidatus Nanoarchaeia archaeon]|nr:hypothetical protein [Candidatus Nanoarchaeia archaeon]MDD5551254.1 hypothetical protein [Candidatus Omnitrophota bacterium]
MKNKPEESELTPGQKEAMNFVGYICGLFSKFLLEANGYHCDYKINGERIEDIEKLSDITIAEKLQLAIKEERYEDAAYLKRALQMKNKNSNP